MTTQQEQKKHAGGRPRTVSLPPDEMIALGEEMIKWLKDNPETLHLSQWYSQVKHLLFSEWDTMSKKPEFVPYYEQALQLVGLQYLDKRSNVRDGISQRWQRVYFKDLRDSEDIDLNAEAERKKQVENPSERIVNIYVSPELASGSRISSENISTSGNNCAESRDKTCDSSMA